jgi:hypothetical protein
MLHRAGEWIAAAAETGPGRLALGTMALAVVVLVGMGVYRLIPSALQSRGQKAARAWLAADIPQVQQFVQPAQAGAVEAWLRDNPPPKLDGPKPPQLRVAVQRNDGRTAEVLIQIRAVKKDGTAAHFVFRHRWVSRDGTWYLQPAVNPFRAVAR